MIALKGSFGFVPILPLVSVGRSLEDEEVTKDDSADVLLLVSGISQVPTTSTWSPSLSVPPRSCDWVPGTWTARRLPLSWARISLFLRSSEAPGRDLLAGVDRLDGDQAVDLVRLRDRARHDTAPCHVLDTERVPVRHSGAGSSEGDVVRSDIDRNSLLAVLDGSLVVRDVERRQESSDDRKRHGDSDIADSVRHCTRLSLCWIDLFDE